MAKVSAQCRLKDYFKRMWLEVPGIEDPPKEDSVFRTLVRGVETPKHENDKNYDDHNRYTGTPGSII